MGKLSPEILEEFLKRKIFKTEQAARNFISKIKINECPSATQNAAAQVAALIKGFSIAKKLKKEDKESLPHNLSEIVEKYKKSKKANKKNYKITTKNITPPYGKDFLKDANANARIYPYLYILENSLRKLILKTFERRSEWWNDKRIVPKNVQDYAKRIQEAEKKYKWVGKRGDHPIYYIGLSELFKIIEKNWNDFRNTFKHVDLNTLRTWFKEIIPIRNLIAHNIKTQKEERDNIKIRTKYICNLIEK